MARRTLMLREGKAPVWDRLLTMLFLAALLHGLIIIGVTFKAAAAAKGGAPGLEVLLVSDELPEADRNPNATYLAQRTQIGSGNTPEAVAPHNRSSTVPLQSHAGTAEGNSLADSGDMAGSAHEQVLTTTAWTTQVRYLADTGNTGTTQNRPLLVDEPPSAQPGPEDELRSAQLRGPKRDELWVTPDTRASIVAPYLDAWRRKVERIGDINYPTAARASNAAANPVLEVEIAAEGTLEQAVITRSSGNPELDQAALAILKLASPFEAFPPEVAAKYRGLRFSYEWQFEGGGVGHSKVTTVP
jgi:protein TonB